MKASKAGVYVSLVFAAIFLVVGLICVFLKPAPSPVIVSEELSAYSSGGYIHIRGKLQNDTDEPLTITSIVITVTTDGSTQKAELDPTDPDSGYEIDEFTLQPGEEFVLTGCRFLCYNTARSLTECKVTVAGVTYTVYENMRFTYVLAAVMFVFTVIFVGCALSALAKAKKQQKHYNELAANAAQIEGNGIFLGGTYAEKGAKGKAAAKTATSVLGGAVSAAFLGVGVYKIYGSNQPREFVVTDNGIYVGVADSRLSSIHQMTYLPKGRFNDCVVTTKKNTVTLFNKVTSETYKFNTKNSNVTPEQLQQRLQALIDYAPAPDPASPAPEASPADDDPFKDL